MLSLRKVETSRQMKCDFSEWFGVVFFSQPCRFAGLCKRAGCTFYHPNSSLPPRHALKWTKTHSRWTEGDKTKWNDNNTECLCCWMLLWVHTEIKNNKPQSMAEKINKMQQHLIWSCTVYIRCVHLCNITLHPLILFCLSVLQLIKSSQSDRSLMWNCGRCSVTVCGISLLDLNVHFH